MRVTTKAMQYIDMQIQNCELDKKHLFQQTKSLLSLYRSVVWAVKGRAVHLKNRISGTYGMQLNTALLFLSDFAPTETRVDFEMQVSSLFKSRWLIELIDIASAYVREYPIYGTLYADLLRLRFMDEIPRNDASVCEALGLERSTYYQRKKEAILLLGISLWEYVLPITIQTYHRVLKLDVTEEIFFQKVAKENQLHYRL
ncbi:MAG: hypothetical protein Q4F21_00700 [Lachnospiraceae bacterium]|nr:hypothetical protein [Lachnospiraceae bacterium]